MNETQARRRGHAFLPPAAELARIPGQGKQDGKDLGSQVIYLHYFSAASDHWLSELWQEEDGTWTGFGYARLASFPEGAEWGYVDLEELEQVSGANGLVIVERDLDWEPRKFSEIKGGPLT